jgi:hypothetical protein
VKRISKAVREDAIEALLCAAEPQTPLLKDMFGDAYSGKWLAFRAFDAAYEALPGTGEAYLEAAALLLDGWNPGDPVEVRS